MSSTLLKLIPHFIGVFSFGDDSFKPELLHDAHLSAGSALMFSDARNSKPTDLTLNLLTHRSQFNLLLFVQASEAPARVYRIVALERDVIRSYIVYESCYRSIRLNQHVTNRQAIART